MKLTDQQIKAAYFENNGVEMTDSNLIAFKKLAVSFHAEDASTYNEVVLSIHCMMEAMAELAGDLS